MSAPKPAVSAVRPPVSLWVTTKAVLWGFLGVRKRADFEKDIVRLNPLHLMVVGVVMAFVFVGALIALVNWVAG